MAAVLRVLFEVNASLVFRFLVENISSGCSLMNCQPVAVLAVWVAAFALIQEESQKISIKADSTFSNGCCYR